MFISKSKIGSFKNHFAMSTGLSELCTGQSQFIKLVEVKELTLICLAAVQAKTIEQIRKAWPSSSSNTSINTLSANDFCKEFALRLHQVLLNNDGTDIYVIKIFAEQKLCLKKTKCW